MYIICIPRSIGPPSLPSWTWWIVMKLPTATNCDLHVSWRHAVWLRNWWLCSAWQGLYIPYWRVLTAGKPVRISLKFVQCSFLAIHLYLYVHGYSYPFVFEFGNSSIRTCFLSIFELNSSYVEISLNLLQMRSFDLNQNRVRRVLFETAEGSDDRVLAIFSILNYCSIAKSVVFRDMQRPI